MWTLEEVCRNLRELAHANGLLGINISVCVDHRVHVEAVVDSLCSVGVHADVHPEGSPLPLPSVALERAINKAAERVRAGGRA
jgi:hypothetical protein